MLACCLVSPAAGAAAAVAANAFQSARHSLHAAVAQRRAARSGRGVQADALARRLAARSPRRARVYAGCRRDAPRARACGRDVAGSLRTPERWLPRRWSASERVAAIACATGSLFAAAEFASARSAWLKKLRMTFEERKREAKDQEGDPHARGRRRALHRSLLRGAIARVREAAFVVTNPTHLAIALEYRSARRPGAARAGARRGCCRAARARVRCRVRHSGRRERCARTRAVSRRAAGRRDSRTRTTSPSRKSSPR